MRKLIAMILLLFGGINSRYIVNDISSDIYLDGTATEEGLANANVVVQNVGFISEDHMIDELDNRHHSTNVIVNRVGNQP